VLVPDELTNTRPACIIEERGKGDPSSSSRDVSKLRTEKPRESSRKSGDRDSSRNIDNRKTDHCGTTNEKLGESDGEEADRWNLAAIQGRIEARQVAKDLELSRSTIRPLKASNGPPIKLPRKESNRDKRETEKKPGSSKPSKAGLAATVAQGVATTVKPLDGEVSGAVTTVIVRTEALVATESKRSRASKRATAECRGGNALSTLKFCAIVEPCFSTIESSGDMPDAELGITLVASALGRKVSRVSSDKNTTGLTECYVELESTKRKSKVSLPAAPPNSVDSDDALEIALTHR